jgi:starvation-inducible outer membrane lipoprotein
MRTLLTIAALALAGCASTPGGIDRDGGFATYDALRAGQAACAARGEQFKLKRNGDPQYIGDYGCEKQ